ncbi:hypothetical protein [Aurantiacibacter spongiae]|uniref:Uncharacterized protein n=1 Tax=Aurantiacibacter spongiae TaxID=2488860 RepID=A0A3N5DNN9_9SPHN|nr:hypothetical protein [Aurantiacibacter spongiae]RPF70681.1 hypothetical protein EG799_02865 [Aurantiacibacter spongiae]
MSAYDPRHLVTLSPDQAAELDPAPVHRSPAGQPVALDPARMAAFLESLQIMGNVSIACSRAGVARQTAYRARRRVTGFARAWDAALVAARVHAESELADRAINGVEEKVFYHGEEVGSRRRYDARLLLAHLARLDRMAERADLADTLARLDDVVEALHAGQDPAEALAAPADGAVGAEVGDGAGDAGEGAAAGARDGGADCAQDPVTPVPPCPDCGGACDDPDARLTHADCQWIGYRLDRAAAARPADAPTLDELADGFDDRLVLEMVQLHAWEAGLAEWWLVTGWDALETALEEAGEADVQPGPGEAEAEAEAEAAGEACAPRPVSS